MVLPKRLARFNKVATNRVTRLVAPRLPGFAMLTHTGRRSGRRYRIPLNVFRAGGDYVIALTYGPDADWVRNVLAAGGCELRTRGEDVRLTNPRLVHDETRSAMPFPVRQVLALVGVTDFLHLTPS
ncbi:deazaflavin-dependent oxidoreductase (nitroreductase family) [Saccharomonospora amisosensis]|uniref:Deazaflavin-dependent oxidoreductase (Nitroreductase family) n=1 Tax=Saccharomonospora amisosensis TaxID=1128677 RepID=A0A7X5URP6_9PSEU|nr:nitroreductase family deazaflavin-dependent oxidoreductase [Saccharomonospora amisosensis]NIJ12652.1 deazaflavin-dependent oxidoreductase (nitroreductase family) [Saccharomonospora amisosensis]